MTISGKRTKKYPGEGTFTLPPVGHFYLTPMGVLLP